VSQSGTNPNAKPDPVTGLTAQEQPGQLGLSWDTPTTDPNPAAIEYHVAVYDNGTLAHQPNPAITVLLPNTTPFGNQIGVATLAPLQAADQGKGVTLAVQVCRQGTNKCSIETQLPYQITQQGNGGGNGNVVDYSAGIVEFEPSFWGKTAIVWSGSATPSLIDYYKVNLSCEPDPANGDPQYQLVTATTMLQNSQQYGSPPAPHAGWNWTAIWLDYTGTPQGTYVTCTAWVQACTNDGTCGSGSNATGFSQAGNPSCGYTGWDYNYDNSCSN